MYLIKAKEMLHDEYQKRSVLISGDYQRDFMLEKIKHSYQVLGVGNFLLKHEKCFADLSCERRDYLQAVVLLHDIGRFFEILEIGQGRSVDHGVYGAQLLGERDLFKAPDCVLPIRHHGHLIDSLYEDSDFKVLPKQTQKSVEEISFLVRDADKLANFYLLARAFREVENVFFAKHCFRQPYSKEICDDAWKNFRNYQCVNRKDVHNFAEQALFFLAWIFDLRYQYSFVFLEKLNILERLMGHFSKFWTLKQTNDITDTLSGYQAYKNKNL